ncbi:hypothetical protein Syun_010850 [Stephania yunnanensis]|uniref:Uncharacterized protein n=1 Tax=Stephania yunnanensis TaxID=152371 RepID=A0AAP0JYQ6_9MAGN
MIKSLKKLKIWARKKKRQKKSQATLESVPPHPLTTTHCCSCSLAAQPSAPPLPPWLDEQTSYYTAPTWTSTSGSGSSRVLVSYSSSYDDEHSKPVQDHAHFPYSEIASPPLPAAAPSYQQYTVETPVYGSLPSVPHQTPREELYAGFFGCVITLGTTLIRCFCPCF